MQIADDAMLVTEYDDFVRKMRARRIALGMSMNDLDERSGLHLGYIAKLENWTHSKSGRTMGPVSMPLWLQALGLAIVLVPVRTIHRPRTDARQMPLPLEGGAMRQRGEDHEERAKLIEDLKRRQAA